MKGKYFNFSNLTGGQLVDTVYFVNKYQLPLKVFVCLKNYLVYNVR